jgi:hypothetical protein
LEKKRNTGASYPIRSLFTPPRTTRGMMDPAGMSIPPRADIVVDHARRAWVTGAWDGAWERVDHG